MRPPGVHQKADWTIRGQSGWPISAPMASWQLPLGALIVVASALVYRWALGGNGLSTDDAHIHLRIARNWASGFGPVFNPGERVEASSSPTWLVLLTLGFRAGVPALALLTTLELLAAAWVGAATAWLAHRCAGRSASWLAPLTLGVLPSFAVWMNSGMETTLAAAVLTTAVALALDVKSLFGAARLGLLLAVLVGIRQETAAVVPLVVGIASVGFDRHARLQAIAVCALTCLAPLVAGLLLRHAYFGSWVPNTYVAKVAGAVLLDRALGVLYVAKFAAIHVGIFALAAWTVARRGSMPLCIALLIGGYLAAVAWTGGDHFFYHRLALPTLPLLSVLAALAPVSLGGSGRILSALVLALQIPWALFGNRQMAYARVAQQHVRHAEAIGEAMSILPAGTVATIAIGGIGYVTGRPILDLVGLADATIARSPRIPGAKSGHNHGDVDYVLRRRPEFVIPMVWVNDKPMDDEEERSALITLHESTAAAEQLVLDPRFRERYAPFDLVVGSNGHVRVWQRRDLISFRAASSSSR